jgi:hypothetical protein
MNIPVPADHRPLTRTQKIRTSVLVGFCGMLAIVFLGASSCNTNEAASDAMQDRMDKAAANILCGDKAESLECKNLREKEKRNSDPNRIGYVYLYNFDGSIKGYFVVKGKVSSTQSQMGAMDMVVDACPSSDYCPEIMEAAGDDGTYGPNEDGIFFFLANGTMVTYSGEYILTDKPLELQVKQLG